MELGNCIVYASLKGRKGFKAFSVEDGCCVGNVMHASTVDDSKDVRKLLQDVANDNRHLQAVFQLRKTNAIRKVVFQTR